MKFSVVSLLSWSGVVSAANSFAGSNLYYAAGLSSDEQTTLLSGLQDANVKVLRVWLDGESGPQKGTNFQSYNGLEGFNPGDPNGSGGWDDTVLNNLDNFMANAKNYGIKLTISMYSYNALESNPPIDYYGKWYGTGDFYTDPNAIQYFENRIAHIMSHVNPNNGKSWADSSEYIFSFEAQNEAMHDVENESALVSWQCTMAQAIKSHLSGSDILVSTGGGSYLATSLLDGYFTCDALDVLAIHAYGTGDFAPSALQPYIQQAQSAGKKLIIQEFGACYYTTSNNRCNPDSVLSSDQRDQNIQDWTSGFGSVGMPWQYWQILPNEDPHNDWDYEVGIGGVDWDALKGAVQAASGYSAAFDFSQWLP